ncbi:predicted protein [Sclerotinia sclerotiorum 1980 UF-70]|uniref:Uncharacterized protein n=1 Tax=Sclerotinia sclerotiorum (strain ATCC 18683 / 1980 / Ss-1) TaxID=665079 RepID=A7E5N2_SCLS1|nr:predicted protein [Sclerotinia sclerotiorum 1980 UF-70]EDN91204.1 predicted protein [Sclerotinia sclerotiorum 1980 UF-70]
MDAAAKQIKGKGAIMRLTQSGQGSNDYALHTQENPLKSPIESQRKHIDAIRLAKIVEMRPKAMPCFYSANMQDDSKMFSGGQNRII